MLAPRKILHRTPVQVADEIAASGLVRPTDLLGDLGCGDAAVLVEVCRLVGCRGFGVDLEESRIAEAKARAEAAGVASRVELRVGNALDVDLAQLRVDVLFVFLIR